MSTAQSSQGGETGPVTALIGAAGFVAPRHLQAMRETGCRLVAAMDPHDSVGVLDNYYPKARFFTEIERLDRHLELRRRDPDLCAVEYVSVCSPNYLHDAHVRLALRLKADAICEKPLVINPWNLDQLLELEQESGRRVNTILQLRCHPEAEALKQEIASDTSGKRHQVVLTYVTRRGSWYQNSWKGDDRKSGGLAVNIGIHFFDLLLWLFGPVEQSTLYVNGPERTSGTLELERATVRWYLSIAEEDLPADVRAQGGHAFRRLSMDDREIDLSANFLNLHTEAYRRIFAGEGFGIDDARLAVDTLYQIRSSTPVAVDDRAHPMATSPNSGRKS